MSNFWRAENVLSEIEELEGHQNIKDFAEKMFEDIKSQKTYEGAIRDLLSNGQELTREAIHI